MKLTKQETATVLAALRLAQQNHLEFSSMPHFEKQFGDKPLSMAEIDTLCERINTDQEPHVIAMQWGYDPAGYRYFLCNPPVNSDDLHAAAAKEGFRLVIMSQYISHEDVRNMLKLDENTRVP